MLTHEPDPIQVTQRGAALLLTLDRPTQKNSLSRATLHALGRLARAAIDNPSVRALVITGGGDQVFCAGVDLKERQGMTSDEIRQQLGLYRTELGLLDRSPKPVIAALNGIALGGGLELALLCDLRVAASHVIVGLPETSLGIIPGAGGTQRLRRLVGEGRAKEMVLLGRRLCADEALAWGLVNRVTPPGVDLLEDTLQWIAPITEGAPRAQAAALEAIDLSFDVPLAVGLSLEAGCYESVLQSEDRVEALRAFFEKRKPLFRGQ